MINEEISIRNYTATDFNFIINSWLKSYYDTSPFTEQVSHKVFFDFHPKVIKNILSRETTKALIASDPETTDLIYGYAIFEQTPNYNIFHYIYIKRGFNNFGISKKLIDSAPFSLNNDVFASHLTRKGLKLVDKFNMQYNPYLI